MFIKLQNKCLPATKQSALEKKDPIQNTPAHCSVRYSFQNTGLKYKTHA